MRLKARSLVHRVVR